MSPETPGSLEGEIAALLEARRNALLAADADALETLLHPEFRYVDSLGRELGREPYLASRRDGEVRVSRQDVTGVGIQALGPGAVLVTCRVHDVGTYRGAPFEGRYRASHVCVRGPGGWLFLYGQSTAIEAGS